MLMTKPELTEHGQKLLAVLRGANGQWMNRKAIAEAMHRNKLYIWDVKLLDDMVNMGLIEKDTRPMSGLIGFEYVYRLKE